MINEEEAIKILTQYIDYDAETPDYYEMEKACKVAIKALEQAPYDCISREEVCDYIAEFVNHEYATDREREMVKNIIGGIQHLSSIQPTTKENLVVEDAISRQAVLDKMKERDEELSSICPKDIKDLPPVTPKPKTGVLDKIRAEIHATAEMHEDGNYYLRDEWIDEIIDKYKAESEDKE